MQLTNALPAALLAYAAGVAASPDHEEGHSDYTPAVNCGDDVCYSVVVPEATADSGSGPVWFQIYAPTRYAWVGLGTGTAMGNANMFIVYQDGSGNVTLSHRQASGFVMPEVPQDSDVVTTLLAGTGVSDGYMVANFRCDNCTTWKDGETLDFSSAGTPMIGAWYEGDSIDSTDVEAPILRHNLQPRKFSLNLSTALKSTAGNPFVDQFAVPGESDSGDAEEGDDSNYMDGDDAEDTTGDDADGESAGVGMFSLASGSVASAAIMMALSFVL